MAHESHLPIYDSHKLDVAASLLGRVSGMFYPGSRALESLTDPLTLDILKFVITELGSGNRDHHGQQLEEDIYPAWTCSCY